jgi:hypothetical protein
LIEGFGDPTVLEAASWRLASELTRRHPQRLRIIRGHPGGGQNDVLGIMALDGSSGQILLNRVGSIQIHARFDGREPDWPPTGWDEQLAADPREFLHRLEAAAGLPAPSSVPAATPRTLTFRVLASIAATAFKTPQPIDIEMGWIDTSGGGGGHNTALELFTAIPDELLARRDDDYFDQPGYRFWVLKRGDETILCFEHETGSAWTRHHDVTFDLMTLYEESRRHLLVTTMKLLRRVDHA